MYYDIEIDDRLVLNDVQGATCDELHDFITDKTGSEPHYGTYGFKARDFACWLASRHKAEGTGRTYDGVGFSESDTLYYEDWVHFGLNDALSMSNEESIEAFNRGLMLFGVKISDDSVLNIFVS